MKVVLTAGGTGGHIYPAIGIIDKLKENNDEFIYIGTTDRMESNIIPSLGYKYYGLEIKGLSKNLKRNVKNIKKIIKSYKESKKILTEFKPDVVIGFGGYVTFPVLLAAKKLGIKTMIHEQNFIPGKTNKILGKMCDKVFVSFKESEKYFNKNKVIYSSNPTGERALKLKKTDKTKLGFDRKKKLIIIVMGSLGSRTVNEKLYEFLKTYKSDDKEILFIAGKNFYKTFDKRKFKNKNVKIVEFYNNLPSLMKDADLIISRAGASTITEIEALEIPSILIPSPYVANNHQMYNAMAYKNRGLSILLEEDNLNGEKLNILINSVLDNKDTLNRMKDAFKKNKRVNGAEVIYKEIKRK